MWCRNPGCYRARAFTFSGRYIYPFEPKILRAHCRGIDRSHASHAPAVTTCNSRAQIIRPAARPLPKPCFFVRAKCAQDPRWSAPDRNQAIDSVLEDFLQEITERRPPDEHAMSSTG
jgi:hypothetical protein